MKIENEIKSLLGEMEFTFNSLDDRLKEDCGIDSLTLVSVIIETETLFGIIFDDSDLEPSELITVGDIVKLVEKYI